jgi:hypothetical protein
MSKINKLLLCIVFACFSTPLAAVTLTAPNGGEKLQIDDGQSSQTTQVQWSGISGTNTIRIDLSVDGGQNYLPIATLPNTSQTSYTWDFAAQLYNGAPVRSYHCRLRIAVNGADLDASNGDFAVFEEYEPNIGEERMFYLINRGRQNPMADGVRYVPRSGGDILRELPTPAPTPIRSNRSSGIPALPNPAVFIPNGSGIITSL